MYSFKHDTPLISTLSLLYVFHPFLRLLVFLCLQSTIAKVIVLHGDEQIEHPRSEHSKEDENLSVKQTTGDENDTVKKKEDMVVLDGINNLKNLLDGVHEKRFSTQEDRMMKLIINSLYKNKDVFLRELISNCADALDKIRYKALFNSEVLQNLPDLVIRIKADKEKRLLHITDTGVGMTSVHLEQYLGTIAKSETSELLRKFEEEGSTNETMLSDFIGQFGVGFYSAFLVADRVIVTSKHNDDDQYIWDSDSQTFKIIKDPRGNTLIRGTTVTLVLKPDADEYLEPYHLKQTITKYSQFIGFPIYLWNQKTEEIDESVADKAETPKDDVTVDEVKDEKAKPKKTTRTVWFWDRLNNMTSIWRRKPSEVTVEEYNNFYRLLTKDTMDPLTYVHIVAEGELEFRSLLFVPKVAKPHYHSMMTKQKMDNIKLYVRRVLINDKFDDLLPQYLSFVCGIVDSDDFPLNVSREKLQQDQLIKLIRKKLIRKLLDKLNSLPDDLYETFWKEFGTNIKLGLTEDHSNRLKLAELLRFYTSSSPNKFVSLKDYVKDMKPDQENIYFLSASSVKEAQSSPFLERLRSKQYDVFYFVDPIDQFCIQSLAEYKDKKFVNIAKEGLELDKSDAAKKQKEATVKLFEPLIKWIEDSFKDKVSGVVLSERLVHTPMVFVAPQWGYDGNMEKISKAQAFQKVGGDSSTLHFSSMKKKLEINPRHPIIKDLLERVKLSPSDTSIKEQTEILIDCATIRSGYDLKDPVSFTSNVEKIMREIMQIPADETAEEIVEDEPSEQTKLDLNSSKRADEHEEL